MIMPIRLMSRLASLLLISALLIPDLRAEALSAAPPGLDLPVIAAVRDCPALVREDLSKAVGAATLVSSATVVGDAPEAAYCKVQIDIDDYAHLELHLPLKAWTQRLLFGAGPGAQVARSAVPLEQFVTASWRDLGHRSHEDDFATNYPYRVNAAYRGMHWQVLAAKALIARFYGQAPRFAYYNACSEPGREGMMEVQRFPQDFDGVGAGCPPLNFTINNGLFQAWNVLTNTGADGKPIITADKLPILHQAVLAQCDAADGAGDGIIADPFSCHPDVTRVQCRAGQDPATCLTPAQVRVAQELYRGAHDTHGGKLAPIGVLPGSELAWTATIVPNPEFNPREPRDQTTTAIRSQFSDPALPQTWELGDLKFDRATFEAVTRLHYLYDATNTDLSGFAKAGHKLILWQALGDTNVLPAHAVLYYTALQQRMGAEAVERFVRFYELPGVYHCGGGDGPVIADLLGPLMAWVERGIAPGALPGVHVPRAPGRPGPPGGGGPGAPGVQEPAAADLTRPIYPYPYTARYSGRGSLREAANFSQGPAVKPPAASGLTHWFGSRFYAPQPLQWCTGDAAGLHCKASP